MTRAQQRFQATKGLPLHTNAGSLSIRQIAGISDAIDGVVWLCGDQHPHSKIDRLSFLWGSGQIDLNTAQAILRQWVGFTGTLSCRDAEGLPTSEATYNFLTSDLISSIL